MATMEKLKLSAITWDSNKDKYGLIQFMEAMSELVRQLAHGEWLENLLDFKLKRWESSTSS